MSISTSQATIVYLNNPSELTIYLDKHLHKRQHDDHKIATICSGTSLIPTPFSSDFRDVRQMLPTTSLLTRSYSEDYLASKRAASSIHTTVSSLVYYCIVRGPTEFTVGGVIYRTYIIGGRRMISITVPQQLVGSCIMLSDSLVTLINDNALVVIPLTIKLMKTLPTLDCGNVVTSLYIDLVALLKGSTEISGIISDSDVDRRSDIMYPIDRIFYPIVDSEAYTVNLVLSNVQTTDRMSGQFTCQGLQLQYTLIVDHHREEPLMEEIREAELTQLDPYIDGMRPETVELLREKIRQKVLGANSGRFYLLSITPAM